MSGTKWDRQIQQITSGVMAPVAEATITVRNASDNTLATIYGNKALSGSPKSNPFQADTNGRAVFYAAAGVYNITAAKDALTVTYSNEQLGNAQERDTGTSTGNVLLRSGVSTVAISGDYDDLSNKPTLGTASALDAGTANGEVRTNTQNDGRFAQRNNNLSDLENAGAARSNLGLGTAAAASTKNSIQIDTGDLQLVGDAASPGNSRYYGTDSGGTKGFYALPSGGATSKNSIETDGGDLQLVGDTANPGNNKVYGTNGSGVRGFYDAAAGAGDVVGPSSATDDHIAVFDSTTGKLLKDGGVAVAGLATSAQGALADSAVQPARTITAGTGLDGGGDLSADRTLGLSSASQSSLALADTAVQPTRSVSTGTGLTGGGDLSADRTLALDAGSIASLALADSAVQPARSISTGTGLTGGGDLSANRTLALDAGSIASLALADTAVQPARTITAGTGLEGGGDLSANRTLSLTSAVQASLGKADTALQAADIANFETTTQLNSRDTANRDRANHTGTQTLSTISDAGTAAAAGTKNSIQIDTGDLQLVGDAASPGNSRYYGTDSGGTKGFYELPSGGGDTWGSITGTLSSQTDLQNALDAKANLDGSNTFTQLNVDNIRVDGNTISSENSNGDIALTPNGTGKVTSSKNVEVTGAISATQNQEAFSGVTVNNSDTNSASSRAGFKAVGGPVTLGAYTLNAGAGVTGAWFGTESAHNVNIMRGGSRQVEVKSGEVEVTSAISATNHIKPGSFTVATVPSASGAGAGAMIYVSNETGGAVLAFSDGANWRRSTDRNVIS